MKHLLQKLTCLVMGHEWYIVDFFYGFETQHTWNIKECDRCRKAELD